MRFPITVTLFALLALGVFTAPAFADLYTLNVDHCSGTCGGGPYGTVEVTQVDDDIVNITVTLAQKTPELKFVHTGFPAAFAFNLKDPNPNVSVSVLSPPTPAAAGWSLWSPAAGSLHMDGFGYFEYGLICCPKPPSPNGRARGGGGAGGGAGAQPGPLSFNVTAPGLTESSFAVLSYGGSDDVYFAADIIGSNGMTGLVGATLVPEVPEPAAIFLFGTVLLGLGQAIRRRR